VSSGCIRMTNDDVIDLYNRVRVGTRVVVMR
jgi:lipoprotein-anchoring transpeptidase ErfK/SrfK